MSSGIMERNLPVADSIGEGDKVRIVTAAGNSKNVDASQIGGALKVTITKEETTTDFIYSTDKTYRQIANAQSLLFVISNDNIQGVYDVCEFINYGCVEGYGCSISVLPSSAQEELSLGASTMDEILTYEVEK